MTLAAARVPVCLFWACKMRKVIRLLYMQRSLGVSQLTIFSLLIIFPHKCKIDTTIYVLSSPVNLWRILHLCKILNKMSRGRGGPKAAEDELSCRSGNWNWWFWLPCRNYVLSDVVAAICDAATSRWPGHAHTHRSGNNINPYTGKYS